MTSEVVIDVKEKEISIALLEDKDLVEFQTEPREASFCVGNIYLAKVKKLLPGLNACFVDIGYEKDAFLHYLDLGIKFNTFDKYIKQVVSNHQKLFPFEEAKQHDDLPKEGTIGSVLKAGQEVLVQVVKEPISTKGPRLTGEISIAGRYIVLMPFGDRVAVSSKIKSGEERNRLKKIVKANCPVNCGVIVRTVAENIEEEELCNEMKVLVKRWMDTLQKICKTTVRPKLVFEEMSRSVALIRDLFNPTYENVYVNDRGVFEEIQSYISLIAPEKTGIVKEYTGSVPVFDNFNITRQIKSGFGKIVNYKHGSYLYIEHTEAMHVIDVNSGNRSRGENTQEQNALEVNLGAADEIARQLRLRDMGGIVIVDFIDMNVAADRQLLYERMCKNMQKDRARHNILPLSKFGLMQITRQRVRPAMDVHVDETCPTCMGKGTIRSSILFTETLEQKLEYVVKKLGVKKITLLVHPYVEAYISKGLFSLKRKWQLKYGFGVKVVPSQAFAFLQYEFQDAEGHKVEVEEI